ncbi:unnamed protein product [Rotaria sp. Silwood2]|nr:unnamed protein product [Rotaria sp. Silwood2]CAF2860792.1 unnamed protein product [Rotaria sp. Silwood2]CAF3113128.1 unnamed protein product [Rotaria sp. Silwood2]CAF3243732.1 unnamed protein product [Rotaria sp. Silwood2]CAF3963047.1 unnamed protein product [Rotaria sp. Silwood2]
MVKEIVADFIIVGGGTAGCVLATRLAEHGFEILLISSGSNDTLNPLMNHEEEFVRLQRTPLFKHYLPTKSSPNLNNRTVGLTVWNTLGGNSINSGGMVRMMANDWNAFVNATGDPTFHYDNMARYYKMSENFTSAGLSQTSNIHGNNGPIKITQGHDAIFKNVWKNVADELNEIFSEDFAGTIDHGLSFEAASFTDGLRSWSGKDYLIPAMMKYPNLKVMTNAVATKFNLNEITKHIENVLFVSSNGFFCGIARRDYILSAGTFLSPHLLMLSGIGDPDILRQHQVPIKHELKHVGKHLMDNGVLLVRYKVENLPIYKSKPVGLVNLQSRTTSTNPNMFFILKMDQRTKYVSIYILNALPKSPTGSISLHKTSLLAPPEITLNYLEDKKDLETFIDSIHYVRKMMATDTLKEFGPIVEILPGLENMDLAKYVRDTLLPAPHFVGTCSMGRNAQDSVVNNQFKVHGINNLRIVDASIFPAGLASKMGPCLTVYALAEKAADLLCNEHI